jgi:hypothetical protein
MIEVYDSLQAKISTQDLWKLKQVCYSRDHEIRQPDTVQVSPVPMGYHEANLFAVYFTPLLHLKPYSVHGGMTDD